MEPSMKKYLLFLQLVRKQQNIIHDTTLMQQELTIIYIGRQTNNNLNPPIVNYATK